MPASVELRRVTVGAILQDVSLSIPSGQAVALIGRDRKSVV